MLKPMQLTMVSEVPLDISGAFCATNVENKGESAITTTPQKNRKVNNNGTELTNKNNGDTKQHIQDNNKDAIAVLFTPRYCDRYPPANAASPGCR